MDKNDSGGDGGKGAEGTGNGSRSISTSIETLTRDAAKYECLLADGQKAIIRWHSPDPVAASNYPEAASGNRWTAQIKIGNKQLKTDGTWTRNQSLNEVHVPIEGN
ncbi:hypothetical protein [Paenibacillus sp. Marseille-Q4541]|uniref:hypothetical protein n=1 Tax=Paenibacillus sp. Marseille-Q4541 TaxID=2831522 RepID=UPI002018D12A|nr:hypothetical protein [Paenibacillus sp. Marseille-Q4541]